MSPRLFLSILIVAFTVVVSTTHTQPTFASAVADDPHYDGGVTTSSYITMRDGVKIAVDVMLPKGLPAGTKIPVILDMTRYWRNNSEGLQTRYFVTHGYAMVLVDVRGTGASTGVWPLMFSHDEVMDGTEIVNWIIAQPWSSGKVGALGISYEGSAAQFLAVCNHPAVKAVIPRFHELDTYADMAYPGGIFDDSPVKRWSAILHDLDNSHDIKPVDDDTHYDRLKEALKDHTKNIDIYKSGLKLIYRDDKFGDKGLTIDSTSIHSFQEEIEQSKVPIYGWGGWMDAATGHSVIERFLSYSNPQKVMIGPWNHGAFQNASPYATPFEPNVPQMADCLRFFDHYLKDNSNGIDSENEIYYYTMGEEKWKSTKAWPPVGSTVKNWYLGEDHTLAGSAPQSQTGEDKYKIDFDATTGTTNRWQTEVGGGPVFYPDRAQEDRRLLTYTSSPLSENTEITGTPVIDLFVKSTHPDGAFFVYLEDVDETGKVTYLTEGELRGIHRKISGDTPPYKELWPYHSFKQKDSMPLVPGQIAELEFGLLTTSVLVRKGHRIRVAIAGSDKDTFARIPAEGTPEITVARSTEYASSIQIPIISRPSSLGENTAPWQRVLSQLGVEQNSLFDSLTNPANSIGAGQLPTVDQIIDKYIEAIGGRDAVARISSRATKAIRVNYQGADERVETYLKEPDKARSIRKSIAGTVTTVTVGPNVWAQINDEPPYQVKDASSSKSKTGSHILQVAIHLKDNYSNFAVKGPERLGDRMAYAVSAIDRDGKAARFLFDAESGLLLGLIQNQSVQVMSLVNDKWTTQTNSIEVATYYSDYRDVDGVKVPFRLNAVTGTNVTTTFFTEIKQNVPIDDSGFTISK